MANEVQAVGFLDGIKDAWNKAHTNSWYSACALIFIIAYLCHNVSIWHGILLVFGIITVLWLRNVARAEGAAGRNQH
jgi:Flp pilus assembly protein TadB